MIKIGIHRTDERKNQEEVINERNHAVLVAVEN
jgi:hypothetical protein